MKYSNTKKQECDYFVAHIGNEIMPQLFKQPKPKYTRSDDLIFWNYPEYWK